MGASAGISVRTLSANSGADEGAACVSSHDGRLVLDFYPASEDVGWGPWEVVLPAAQVPEGITSGAPLYGASYRCLASLRLLLFVQIGNVLALWRGNPICQSHLVSRGNAPLETPRVPFTATLQRRPGPIWPAKLAHFFAATNIYRGF